MFSKKSPNAILASSRARVVVSGLLLALILFFVIYRWLTLPALTLVIGWDAEERLSVVGNAESVAGLEDGGLRAAGLDLDDIILAVDGRVARRGETLFVPPVKERYTLTLSRGGETVTQVVALPPVTRAASRGWQIFVAVAALAFWLMGTFTFLRARRTAALITGAGFQLAGAWITSPGLAINGVPGAWLLSEVTIFFFPVFLLALGALPLTRPLGRLAHGLLLGSAAVATVLAVVSALEFLFLFPDNSLAYVAGISSFQLLRIFVFFGATGGLVLLLVRAVRAERGSYERQQMAILLVCFALAVLPILLFAVLPTSRFLLAPMPVVYGATLFIPAGYVFVLNRGGLLLLDRLFARLLVAALLLLAVGLSYVAGVAFLDLLLDGEVTLSARGGWFLAVALVGVGGQRQVQAFVEILLYGEDAFGETWAREVSAHLAANPAPAVVAAIAAEAAARLNAPQAVVLVRDGDYYLPLAEAEGVPPLVTVSPNGTGPEQGTVLRDRNPAAFAGLPRWAALAMPLILQERPLGLLLMARPGAGGEGSFQGAFNARQVAVLEALAPLLAIGLSVAGLLEAERRHAGQRLYDRRLQQQQTASSIHDGPLQTLLEAAIHLKLDEQKEAEQDMEQAMRQMRRLIAAVRPPALTHPVTEMVRDLAGTFAATHDGIDVCVDVTLPPRCHPAEPARHALFSVLAEALNNVARHAGATRVRVSLDENGGGLTLTVVDNGRGATVGTLSENELVRAHQFGVANMYRWAEIGGGQLAIRPTRPERRASPGTTVILWLPAGEPDPVPSTLNQTLSRERKV